MAEVAGRVGGAQKRTVGAEEVEQGQGRQQKGQPSISRGGDTSAHAERQRNGEADGRGQRKAAPRGRKDVARPCGDHETHDRRQGHDGARRQETGEPPKPSCSVGRSIA